MLRLLRFLLWLAAVAIACPIRYHAPSAGLDESWAVALNQASSQGLIHGRDIGFTYGPWAWVALPMAENLGRALAWQAAMWLGFAGLLAIAAWRLPLANLGIFTACLLAGERTFASHGFAGPDLYLSFAALVLIAFATAFEDYWAHCFAAAVAAAGALFLIKLTSGIFAASAIGAWPVGMLLFDRRKAAIAGAAAAAGIPLAFAGLFLLHHASLATFVDYARVAWDISSGFSVAMSMPGEPPADLHDAALLGSGFLGLLVALAWRRQKAAVIAFCTWGPLFLSFKHAFVRPAGHVEILFTTAPLLLGAIVLVMDVSRPKQAAPWIAAAALLAGVWLRREAAMPWRNFDNLKGAAAALDLPALRRALEERGRAQLAVNVIAAGLPKRTTAVFPYESSAVAANGLPPAPFGTLQTYTAYTGALDRWNAATLRAEQLLVHWGVVDGRHPFLDSPALVTEIARRYDFEGTLGDGRWLLLKRRSSPRFGALRKTGEAAYKVGEVMQIEGTAPSWIAVHVRLSWKGQLQKFFWRLPELQIVLTSKAGRILAARLVADVLANPVGLGLLPENLDVFRETLAGNTARDPYNELLISGPAASLYEPIAKVEYFTVDDWNGLLVSRDDAPVDLSRLLSEGEARAAKLDSINEIGMAALGATEVAQIPCPRGFALLRGWAFDFLKSKPASAVYLEIDGGKLLLRTDYGHPRIDNVALFRDPLLERTGFAAALPVGKLAPGPHELRVAVVSADGLRYSRSANVYRFQLNP